MNADFLVQIMVVGPNKHTTGVSVNASLSLGAISLGYRFLSNAIVPINYYIKNDGNRLFSGYCGD